MKKSILFLIFATLPLIAGGMDPSKITISEMFKPADQDISIMLLKTLFGGNNMIDALAGPSNELVRNIFKTLNLGVLYIASILLTYTISTGVLRTAQDGGMSQIGKISPMTVFRIVSGLSIMSPIPAVGFSTIQMGVIWAAVHGIGFADTIFSYVANNFTDNASVIIPSKSSEYSIEVVKQRTSLKQNTADAKDQYVSNELDKLNNDGDDFGISFMQNVEQMIKKAVKEVSLAKYKKSTSAKNFIYTDLIDSNGPIGKSIVNYSEPLGSAMCLATVTNYYLGSDSECKKNCDKGFAVRSLDCSKDGSSNLCFGTSTIPDLCGSYKVKGYDTNSLHKNAQYNYNEYKEFIETYKKNRKLAMKVYQEEEAKKLKKGSDKEAIDRKMKEIKKASLENNVLCKDKCLLSVRLASLAATQVANIPDSTDQISNIKGMNKIATKGWVAAAYNIDKLTSGFKSEKGYNLPESNVLDKLVGKIYQKMNLLAQAAKSDKFNATSAIFTGTSISVAQRVANSVFVVFVSSILGIDTTVVVPSCAGAASGCFKGAIDSNYIILPGSKPNMYKPMPGILGSIAAFSKSPLSHNPLLQIKNTGITLFNIAYGVFVNFPKQLLQSSATILKKYKAVLTGVGAASITIQTGLEFIPPLGIYPIGHVAAVALDAVTDAVLLVLQLYYKFDITELMLYVPIVGSLIVVVLGVGFIMAVWIPIIPVLIFSLVLIGWFFTLIEALVAAPLVAVGITHPEGHDFLGQAQQSFMLLLMVFLRPVLILFGLLTSVILLYFVVYVINIGFLTTLLNVLTNDVLIASNSNHIYFAIVIMSFCIIYAYILSSAVTMTFSNIYRVPERVSIWIGGQPEQSPISQILDKTKAQIGQAASQAGMGASTAISDTSSGKAAGVGSKGASGPEQKEDKQKDHKASAN